jgi:hypothetical protein
MPNLAPFSGIQKPDAQDLAVRNAAKTAIRSSGKSREQIADELSARVGRPITVRMLDDFTAPSKGGARFPAALVGPFCEVTGCDDLQYLLLTPRVRGLAKLGECELAAQRQRRDKNVIVNSLLQRNSETGR